VYLRTMLFAYLDEFGHIGPFVHRQDLRYKDSPVFGMAGIILPEPSIRPFSAGFLRLKEGVFRADIARAERMPFNWEKKGQDIFRPKALDKYPALREVGFRLLSLIRRHEGKVYFYGREKIVGMTDGNPTGMYTTVFSKTIRGLDAHSHAQGSNFALVVDEHSARKELLECAAKTMYGAQPARRLVSPPFEVESYLNQHIQAADWIASIVGRIWAHRTQPEQFKDHEIVDRYFGNRVTALATNSRVEMRPNKKRSIVIPSVANDTTEQTSQARPTLRYSILDKQQ